MPSLRNILSTLLLSSTPLVVGCAEMGERAQNGCPVGETCSPTTPEGLTFSGASVGDALFGLSDELYPIAVGGTQNVSLWDLATNGELRAPYTAVSDAAGVTVAASDGNDLTLRATAAGAGRLRVLATDGTLMDRIAIEASPVASVALTWPWLGEYIGARRPVKLWIGARQELVIALYDAQGRRLVDDSATIRLTGPGWDFDQWSWDSFSLGRVPTAATATSFAIDVGGTAFDVNVEAVESVDAVEAVPALAGDVRVGDTASICFIARSGEAHVLGAPWQFAVNGAGTLVPGEDDGLMDNCAQVRADAAGIATVTAWIGAATTTTAVAIAPRPRRAARVIAPVDVRADAPAAIFGDRARPSE